jgi:hypothetical protein
MAFPQVVASNTSSTSTDQTSHTVNLPTGIGAGDLLVVIFVTDGTPTVTFPGTPGVDWIEITNSGGNTPNTAAEIRIYYRVATGAEASTISVTTSNAQETAHVSLRIEGHNSSTNAPEAASATGTDAAPNPPTDTPGGGVLDYLWIEAFGANTAQATSPHH